MSLESEKSVLLLRRVAFLLLACAVFGPGLHARLNLYRAKPKSQLASAKLSMETRSAVMLKSIEVQSDEPQPSVLTIVAFLLSSFCDTSDPARHIRQVAIALLRSNSLTNELHQLAASSSAFVHSAFVASLPLEHSCLFAEGMSRPCQAGLATSFIGIVACDPIAYRSLQTMHRPLSSAQFLTRTLRMTKTCPFRRSNRLCSIQRTPVCQ